MKTFEIVSVNVSLHKGVPKRPVEHITLVENHGVQGDAHGGPGKRQVSLLAIEDIQTMQQEGASVACGDFAENITTRGIDLPSLPVGSRLAVDTALLEISQIGKQCHTGCAIIKHAGACIMPKRGVFARVLQGGEITNESIGSYGF